MEVIFLTNHFKTTLLINLCKIVGQSRGDNILANNMNSLEYEDVSRKEKLNKQQMYKDILNYQCQLNKKLKTQGGMTGVEKEMNKRELNAYKHFENNSFGMIPGLNGVSQFMKYKKGGTRMMHNLSANLIGGGSQYEEPNFRRHKNSRNAAPTELPNISLNNVRF